MALFSGVRRGGWSGFGDGSPVKNRQNTGAQWCPIAATLFFVELHRPEIRAIVASFLGAGQPKRVASIGAASADTVMI
jgi:hypothetical protein